MASKIGLGGFLGTWIPAEFTEAHFVAYKASEYVDEKSGAGREEKLGMGVIASFLVAVVGLMVIL